MLFQKINIVETTFNSIKLTLVEFIKVEDETIKNTINEVLDKTKFYYSDLDEQYSALNFLGYNVVIRNYFKDINNKDIKVVQHNVIAHEIIHLQKNLQEFNKDIVKIYNKTCKQKENKIQYLTVAEYIQQNILRHKMNFKNYVFDKQFGYCYKHFLIKENNY